MTRNVHGGPLRAPPDSSPTLLKLFQRKPASRLPGAGDERQGQQGCKHKKKTNHMLPTERPGHGVSVQDYRAIGDLRIDVLHLASV